MKLPRPGSHGKVRMFESSRVIPAARGTVFCDVCSLPAWEICGRCDAPVLGDDPAELDIAFSATRRLFD